MQYFINPENHLVSLHQSEGLQHFQIRLRKYITGVKAKAKMKLLPNYKENLQDGYKMDTRNSKMSIENNEISHTNCSYAVFLRKKIIPHNSIIKEKKKIILFNRKN